MLISIAIPCYNSSKTLPYVVEEIQKIFSGQSEYSYQIVLVNDNSPDNTYDVICDLCGRDPNIIGIDLSKNYGQASAQMAAAKYADGDIVVFMDDDGQHPAAGIFTLAEEIRKGNDLVYAHFAHKKHSVFKRFTSWLNSKILAAMNLKPKGIYISSYFALSRFAVNSLKKYRSPFPSIGGYLFQITRRVTNVEMDHQERKAGSSNYTLKKLLRLWLQGITNFSIVPLRIASLTGMISATIGFLYGIILVIRKLIDPNVFLGYTSLMAAILVIGGLVMIMLGMLGEYVGRIYILLSDMPQYNVREIVREDGRSLEEK